MMKWGDWFEFDVDHDQEMINKLRSWHNSTKGDQAGDSEIFH